MKTNKLKRISICAATVFCSQMLLLAQQSDQTTGKPGQRKGTAAQAEVPSDGGRASKLKGADVKSKNGEDLGKLEDFVVDRRTGQISFAIVGKGRPLGLGEKPHP